MQNLPITSSSSSHDSSNNNNNFNNNIVLVTMNGKHQPTTTTITPNLLQQQPQLFIPSQTFLTNKPNNNNMMTMNNTSNHHLHQQQIHNQQQQQQQPMIFFQNHLLPQTNNNNNQHVQPVQLPLNMIPTTTPSANISNSSSTTANNPNSVESVVDMENFAKFQQEQAKQFSIFQQQQAAVFLQMAIQQKQLESVAQFAQANHMMNVGLPTGIPIGSNVSTSTTGNFLLKDASSSINAQPIFIPNTTHHHNHHHHNNGTATIFDHSSPMSESILSSSPSNLVTTNATNIDSNESESTSPSAMDEKERLSISNQRRTGPVRRSRKGGWSEEEDEMLRVAVQTYGGKNWKKIAETLQNRTSVQCLHRWQKVLNPNLVKGPWTKEEDEKILQLVKTYGAENWSMIASHLPGRIGKQCRERWYNHLDPNIKKEPWTEDEENLLLDAQSKLGNKWAEISKLISGRTDNACKNHFNSLIAREKKKDTTKTTATASDIKNLIENSLSTINRKPKKVTKKEDSVAQRARHKRSISDTAFYQSYQYDGRESMQSLAPPTLSPMATSNNSGSNSPNSMTLSSNNNNNNNYHQQGNQPNIFSPLINPNFPFNSPVVLPNSNLVQQNIIPLFRPNTNVQKRSNASFRNNGLVIPNIDISSPGMSTPTDLFHDISAFESTNNGSSNNTNEDYTKLDLGDVQDTLINQVGSGLMSNFDTFDLGEGEVLIHDNSNHSNEGSNTSMTSTPGGVKNRPSTVFNEEMDFNEFGESDLNSFLDDDSTNEQANSGIFSAPFVDRETKRKKFNHVFHNRSISFDVSQLQNKDFFY